MGMYQCLKCMREMECEDDRMHPWEKGHICQTCWEKAGEEFCKAADEMPDDVVSNDDILKIDTLLEILAEPR